MEKPPKTTQKIRGSIAGLNETARALRGELTSAERVLWEALRGRKLNGLKFRRQYPVGRFVLDFYCAELHLAIEVDGRVHDEQAEHDAERTRTLNEFGIRVLRFRNQEVFAELPRVLDVIASATVPSPNFGRGVPSPARRGEGRNGGEGA